MIQNQCTHPNQQCQRIHEIGQLGSRKDASTLQVTAVVECQRILKDWVSSEIATIGDIVNVRMFSFDSEHVLHNGRSALHQAALELYGRFALTEDPTSPLFCSVTNEDDHRSSGAAIFIAHGMGVWLVKEF